MDATKLENLPPRRSLEQLQAWVDDFRAEGYVIAGDLRVLPQEDAEGQDTGLVVIHLHGKQTTVILQPVAYDTVEWQLTLTGRNADVILDPHELTNLAAEMVVAGNLGTYLQWRSLEWDRESGRHNPRSSRSEVAGLPD